MNKGGNKMKHGITIFTPTYNRANTLQRLYDSLIIQKNKNFEWLVVDDGSTDNTNELINNWMNENKIIIRYIYQENHGKTFAYNIGVENAKYEWFLCLDSDDFLSSDAINILLNLIKEYSGGYVGLVSLKKNIVSDNICLKKEIATGKLVSFEELYRKYKCNGDTALVYKTKILIKNPFPIIENEKFVPEQYLHDKMDQEGKLLFFSDKIYCCEYLEDGYSNNTINLLRNNPNGYLQAGKQKIRYSKMIRSKIIGAIQINISNFLLHKHLKEI